MLADRGLTGGIEALALTHSGPVDVDVQLPGRPPAPVESAVYFAVAEAVTNTAKHAAGASLWIWGRYDADADGQRHLRITVADDGVGGATMPPDGGLAGLAQRLETFDGRLTLASPPGAGTVITIDVPCTLQPESRSTSSHPVSRAENRRDRTIGSAHAGSAGRGPCAAP